MIYTVGSSAELYYALARAQGGDTIQLAGGDYGELDLGPKSGFNVIFDSPVKITSLDPNARATFSGMSLTSVENLSFDDVIFDYTFESGDKTYSAPFSIIGCGNISIVNSTFDGDTAVGVSEVDDGYGIAKGLRVADSHNLEISGNEFFNWHRAITAKGTVGIDIIDNEIHSVRSDGMTFAEVESVVIERNYIHDFEASALSSDHRDMIQFFTAGTSSPSKDIVIRDNILDIGSGDLSQSIFMRNEEVDNGRSGQEMFYQNILIEGNVILNGHTHGITVGETLGLTIRENTVLSIDQSDDRFFSPPRINVKPTSENVDIQRNAVDSIVGYDSQSTWTLSHNAFIQNANPDIPGYYWDLFLDSSFYSGRNIGDLVVAPGSILDTLAAGSSMNHLDTNPDTLTPNFDVFTNSADVFTLVFDASHTYSSTGQVLPEDATFSWDFGGGVNGIGQIVGHHFDLPGIYRVALTVSSLSEGTKTVFSEVSIAGHNLLSFNPASGQFVAKGYGEESVIEDSDRVSVGDESGMMIDLGGTGTQLSISKSHIARFFSTDSFEISLKLHADEPGVSWGEVFRIHGNIVVNVQGDGSLDVQLYTDMGEAIRLTTSGIEVNDGLQHDLAIRLNGQSNLFEIFVDGVVAANETVYGNISEMGSHGLVFGNPWGNSNFDGKLSAFNISSKQSDYSVYSGDNYLIFDGNSDFANDDTQSTQPAPDTEGTQSTQPAPDTEGTQSTQPAPDTEGTQSTQPAPDTEGTQSTQHGTEESSLPVIDDYIADFASLKMNNLVDDATVFQSNGGSLGVYLDGADDYVKLGRLKDFDNTEQLSFSVDFRKAAENGNDMRLVWNHQKLGVAIDGDGLLVYVAQSGQPFDQAIRIENLGLDDTEQHNLMIMVNASTDHLQVLLDGELAFDEVQARDIDFGEPGGREWSWLLGTPWGHEFHGEIYDFRLEAGADFVPTADDVSLAA